LPCSLRGKVEKRNAEPSGNAMPPPMPCSTRAAISASAGVMCSARPSSTDAPQSAEAAVKIAIPSMKSFLRPKMSPSRPNERSKTA
jgi:hypothetical protein